MDEEPTQKQWEHSQRLLKLGIGEWEYIRITYWELGNLTVLEGTLLNDKSNFQLRIHNSDGTTSYVPYPCLARPYRIQVKKERQKDG